MSVSIDEALEHVREFHRRIKAPVVERPQLLAGHPGKTLAACILVGQLANELSKSADGTKDIVLCRAALALEELSEWLEGHATFDIAKAADAIGDRLYVLLGDAIAAGLPLAEIFQAVHKSNMSKMKGVQTGVGKAAKGPGYRRPEIAEILTRSGWDRRDI